MLLHAPHQVESFYRAAMLGLRVLETREGRGRRFGPHADAGFNAFRGKLGELGDGDRLDLLLRDAAVAHPAAFAPRVVFAFPGLADDEPFGHEWPGPDAALARTLLRQGTEPLPLAEPASLLDEAASAWGVPRAERSETLSARVATAGRATRILAAGPAALLALTAHFAGRRDMDLADQVLLVAAEPRERHLFGLAALFLGSTSTVRILSPNEATSGRVRALGVVRVHLAVHADDASPAAREVLGALERELSA